jgi:hypothetical protein
MALICLSVSLGAAQSNGPDNKASLTGRVINESGSILRDAQVVLASSTGARLAIPLNNKGVYSVSGLIPGTYKLTVSASNLADAVFDNIALAPDQHLVLDAKLMAITDKSATEAVAAPEAGPIAAAPLQNTTQGEKGAITGTVTDQTGAVVPDAKAVLTGATGQTLQTKVNEKGLYSFTGLDAGTYKLVVSAPNFSDMPFDNINLTAGLELTLDAQLKPGSAKEEVNVESGAVGQVETDSASVSGTITQKEVVSIGLNGRNFTQLVALAPGVSNQTGQDEAKVGVVGSVKYSVNGGRV